ncbi:MAG: hypothetical protein SGBAC_010964 [Bacillariaceae sp.]
MKSVLSLLFAFFLATAVRASEPADFSDVITVVEEHDERHLCSSSIRPAKSCYVIGEQIVAIVSVCTTAVEWFGIYRPGAKPTDTATNWQYTSGGQVNPAPMAINTYAYGFGDWTGPWPLNGAYKFYYHTSAGSYVSSTFTVRASCGGGPPVSSGSNAPRMMLRAPAEEIDV